MGAPGLAVHRKFSKKSQSHPDRVAFLLEKNRERTHDQRRDIEGDQKLRGEAGPGAEHIGAGEDDRAAPGEPVPEVWRLSACAGGMRAGKKRAGIRDGLAVTVPGLGSGSASGGQAANDGRLSVAELA